VNQSCVPKVRRTVFTRPRAFEITEQTRAAIQAWLADIGSSNGRYLFPSRVRVQPHLSTRQYARIVHSWVASAGLDSSAYGTHSMRRTKAAQIYKKTGNLTAVQLMLGHTKLESTVRYLGIEVDDALAISEQVELRTEIKHRGPAPAGPRCTAIGSSSGIHQRPVSPGSLRCIGGVSPGRELVGIGAVG
jgi:hypothetical protein